MPPQPWFIRPGRSRPPSRRGRGAQLADLARDLGGITGSPCGTIDADAHWRAWVGHYFPAYPPDRMSTLTINQYLEMHAFAKAAW